MLWTIISSSITSINRSTNWYNGLQHKDTRPDTIIFVLHFTESIRHIPLYWIFWCSNVSYPYYWIMFTICTYISWQTIFSKVIYIRMMYVSNRYNIHRIVSFGLLLWTILNPPFLYSQLWNGIHRDEKEELNATVTWITKHNTTLFLFGVRSVVLEQVWYSKSVILVLA